MLGLANQSSSVAASELARRWLPNCLIRCADDPVGGSCWNSGKNLHFVIRYPDCHAGFRSAGIDGLKI